MKHNYLIILFLLNVTCNSQDLKWVRYFSGQHSDINAITIDSSDNVVACGRYLGNIQINDTTGFYASDVGIDNVIITKFDSAGFLKWAYSSYSPILLQGNVGPNYITTDANENIYLIGYFDRDLYFDSTLLSIGSETVKRFFVKLSNTGQLLWAKSIGNSNFDLSDIIINSNQQKFLCGGFNNSVTINSNTYYSSGPWDFFFAEIDINGNFLNYFFHDGYNAWASCSMSGNSIYVNANYHIKAIVGGDTVYSEGDYDYLIAKYTTHGIFQWIRNITSPSDNYSFSGMKLKKDRIYLAGLFSGIIHFQSDSLLASGNYGMYIAEYDTSGNFIMAKETGWTNTNPNFDNHKPAVDSKGNIYIAQSFKDTLHIGDTTLISCGYLDGFAAKFDSALNLIWVIQMCDVWECDIYSIALDKLNYLYIAGEAGYHMQVLDSVLDDNGNCGFVMKIGDKDVLPFNKSPEISKPEEKLLSLFPNPTNKTLHVIVNPEIKNGIAEIYSIHGAILKNLAFNSSHFRVDVSELPAGCYFLRIRTDYLLISEKFGVVR